MNQMIEAKNKDHFVSVTLLDGSIEEVEVDPIKGPILTQADGSKMSAGGVMNIVMKSNIKKAGLGVVRMHGYSWEDMTVTEKKVALNIAAKKNRLQRERFADTGAPPPQDPMNVAWTFDWFRNGGAQAEEKPEEKAQALKG
mmetsp:Transcript_24782/g.43742  ORF Transcript_24782/g.43742 Transcript_24782/m.43742 type:complete len:141 (-) Transcript_24782:147-569(-)